MLGKQARCDSNPVVHPLIVTGPANGMQRAGFLVRQAVPRESVEVVQEPLTAMSVLPTRVNRAERRAVASTPTALTSQDPCVAARHVIGRLLDMLHIS